jgi:hypothetical protein
MVYYAPTITYNYTNLETIRPVSDVSIYIDKKTGPRRGTSDTTRPCKARHDTDCMAKLGQSRRVGPHSFEFYGPEHHMVDLEKFSCLPQHNLNPHLGPILPVSDMQLSDPYGW